MSTTSSSGSSKSISVNDAVREYEETVSIIKSLKAQKGLPFHVLREAIEDKSNFSEDLEEHIANVQKFNGEVGQFEHDVKSVESSGELSQSDVAKKIAYEEDQAIQDMKKAAEAVIKFGELKEDADERREKFDEENENLKVIMMTDNYIIVEAILRDLSHYYWDSYSELRVLAKRLGDETGYTQFKKEINKIKDDREIKEAEEIIRENYGGPGSLKKKRHAGLEKNAQKILNGLK